MWKLCGTATCDSREECGNNECLSPYHQSAAIRPGPLFTPGLGATSQQPQTGIGAVQTPPQGIRDSIQQNPSRPNQ
ncbi:MAG TPA: hypothetical protein VGX76_21165 [Pirellulales bacterium]|nr:hypothetical protein [Pirellulales bacterium]